MVEKDIGVIRESNHTVGIFKALASLARSGPKRAHRVETLPRAVILPPVPMPVLRVPTSHPGSQQLASLRALPNPATVAKCSYRVMRKNVLHEVQANLLV